MDSRDRIFGDSDQLDQAGPLLESLAGILADLPMGVAVFDLELRLKRCNKTWRDWALRHSPNPDRVVFGASLLEMLPGIESWAASCAERLRAGETISQQAVPIPVKSGNHSYWDVVLSPLVADDKIAGIVQVSVDATERVRGYQMLEERVEERTREVERSREVAEGLHEVLSILNSGRPLDEVLDFIIGQAKRLLGSDAVSIYRVEICCGLLCLQKERGIEDDVMEGLEIPITGGIVGRTIARGAPMVAPDLSQLTQNALEQMPDPKQQDMLRQVFVRYSALLAMPLIVGGEVYGALAMYYPKPRRFSPADVSLASDLADHLSMAIENAALRDRLEESAATAERSRLARDLHDAVTQTLFSASLIAEVLPTLWERDPAEGRKRLEELRRLTRGALAEMRTLLLELRPTALVEADLGDLLKQLVDATAGTGVEMTLAADGRQALPSDVQIALYRIAQEALNNVARHSRATCATLTLERSAGNALLSVEDDGCGFEPAAAAGEHFGLGIMRERAAAVGATCTVTSNTGRGTTVEVVWTADGTEE